MQGTLNEDQYTFLIIYSSFFLIMRFSGREKQNAYFVFSNFFSKFVPFVR